MRLVLAPILTASLLSGTALADPPPLYDIWSVVTTPGATVLVCPAGDGRRLDAALDDGGSVVDATITVHMFDEFGDPIVGVPAEDIWLESTQGHLVYPPDGTIADRPSDENGITVFQEPLLAGGHSSADERVVVFVVGDPVPYELDLAFNSPDIDGDLAIDLTDVALFAGDYFGGYDARSDLQRDGALDLADLALLAAHYTHE